uniref:Uncharacterized protein n=1 Tax=Rhizophora mucronata TaxID=61149 RepID=A0A2P2Q722_RHIMU
MHWIGFLVSRV